MPPLSHTHTKENNAQANAGELDFICGEEDSSCTADTSHSTLIKPNDHPRLKKQLSLALTLHSDLTPSQLSHVHKKAFGMFGAGLAT